MRSATDWFQLLFPVGQLGVLFEVRIFGDDVYRWRLGSSGTMQS